MCDSVIRKEITRFSMHKHDACVFDEYTMKQFVQFTKSVNGSDLLVYAGAITEDTIPMMFTGDSHLMKRASERMGICYASIVIAEVIEAVEKNVQLGNILLESETMAFEKGHSYGMVALFIEELDLFCYLHVSDSEICVATVMYDFPKYYVNAESDFICCLYPDNTIGFGMKSSRRFAASACKKYHGRK